jgi:uncharacterized membrane protein YbhN (UPF0104 family)
MTVAAVGKPRKPLREGARRWIAPLIGAAACALAGFLVWRIVDTYDLADVAAALRAVPPGRFLSALGFSAASYLCLTAIEFLACRYAGKPLGYPRIALTTFVSLSLGHNIGLAPLSSGAVRYRFYSRWGFGVRDVAKVLLFCGLTVVLGLAVLSGTVLILQPTLASGLLGLGPRSAVAAGAGLLVLVAGYLAACRQFRGVLHIRRWPLRLPPLRLALAQVLLGAANIACVAACLHQALLGTAQVGYFRAAALYVIANLASMISHAPGGLGVMESVILLLLPQADVLAALVIFRVAYFLVPLVIGASVLAVTEAFWRRQGRKSPPFDLGPV